MAQFTNFATITLNGNDINSNITTGELREVLFAEKTALRDVYGQNSDLAYVISITNSGTTAFTGLTITDDLGGYTVGASTVYPLSYAEGSAKLFINGVPAADPTVVAGPPLQFTGITIPADGNAVLAYEAITTNYAPLQAGGQITNTITVTGGGITTPITASETVTAENAPILSITKSLSPAIVSENSQLTYTFIIENRGNTAIVSTDDLIFRDTFDPVLENLIVTFNGASWSEGTNYTYDELTGEFVSLAGQITVPAATFTQNPDSTYTVTPGISTITITGTV